MVCYMVVSPDPNKSGWAVIDNKRGFWVKFGDGQFRPSYGTDNPDSLGVENRSHTDEAIYTPSTEGMGIQKNMKVRLGKALEWEYLQCWSVVHSKREWHFLPEQPSLSLETLRQHLLDAMHLFPDLLIMNDMNMTSSPSTQRFAEIMELLEDYENTTR